MKQKMYVLVRKDLDEYGKSYKYVQAGHAVAEYLLSYPDTQWQNGTLIYLGVRDEFELVSWVHKLQRNNIKCKPFKELDLDNKITALACVSTGELFKRLKLL